MHPDGHLYLLYLPSIQLITKSKGTVVHPSPSTPRAVKPELSYAARLPKDYFRCPVCGGAFDATERTKVPYHALLYRLQQLDADDGVIDGESARLTEIKDTIEKISRNP
eukprot:1987132-Prymnesium_polylepis.1